MTDDLKKLAEAATPGPWEWHTSCSWKRLYQAGNRKPARVIEPYVCSDGHPDISISKEDMDFIVAANPAAVLNLIRERDYAVSEMREARQYMRIETTHAEDAERRATAAEAALSAAREEVAIERAAEVLFADFYGARSGSALRDFPKDAAIAIQCRATAKAMIAAALTKEPYHV